MFTQSPVFIKGKLKRNESLFNTDVLVQHRRITKDRNYTHLFSMECLNTGFTPARYVEKNIYSIFTKIGPFTEKTKDSSIICNLSINREVYFIVLLYLLIHKHLVTFISILII